MRSHLGNSIERKCRVSGKSDPSSNTTAVNTAVCRCTYSSTTHGIVYVDKINTIIIIGLSCILTIPACFSNVEGSLCHGIYDLTLSSAFIRRFKNKDVVHDSILVV